VQSQRRPEIPARSSPIVIFTESGSAVSVLTTVQGKKIPVWATPSSLDEDILSNFNLGTSRDNFKFIHTRD